MVRVLLPFNGFEVLVKVVHAGRCLRLNLPDASEHPPLKMLAVGARFNVSRGNDRRYYRPD